MTLDDGEKPPKPVWPVFLVFVLLLVGSQLIGGVLIGVVLVAKHGAKAMSDPQRAQALLNAFDANTLAAGIFGSVTTLVVVSIASFREPGKTYAERLSFVPVDPKLTVLAVLVGLGCSELAALALDQAQLYEGSNLEQLVDVFHSAGFGEFLVLTAAAGLAGVAEELVFRGQFQPRLRQRWGKTPAIVVTALLFGVMHMDPTHSLFAFIFGLYLGWIFEATGSLLTPIAVHVVNNLFASLGPRYLSEDTQGLAVAVVLTVGIGAALLLRKELSRVATDSAVTQ